MAGSPDLSAKSIPAHLFERGQLVKEAKSVRARKHLGQNFLIEPAYLEAIVLSLDLKEGDLVFEIGPGLGFLTRFLCQSGANVIAVELDRECVEYLEALHLPNLKVVHQDFLQADLLALSAETGGKFKVAGNVPYQITSPIIVRLLGEIGAPSPFLANLKNIVLTMQYEVAQRLIAKAGAKDYSQITLLLNYFADAQIVSEIEADNFLPEPKVRSATVKIEPLSFPPVDCQNNRLLKQLIGAGFAQRRKMLKNNLGFLSMSQEELTSIFAVLNFDPQVRAERLTLAQFARLADELESRRQNK